MTKITIDGVMIKELTRHHDDRGFFEEIIRVTDPFFHEGFGQLSRSSMKQGVIKAWHIHKTQVDWWYVAEGNLKVALYDNRNDSKTYKNLMQLSLDADNSEIVLKIPPGVAHGLKVLSKSAELFYITSKVYNPTEEEGRIPEDDPNIGFNWSALA